jgi:hypothetical protein
VPWMTARPKSWLGQSATSSTRANACAFFALPDVLAATKESGVSPAKAPRPQSIARGNIHHEGTKITKLRREYQKNFPNFVSFVRFVVRLEFSSATSFRTPRKLSTSGTKQKIQS